MVKNQMYSKDKIRVGFALSENDMIKLKKYMSVHNIENVSKAFVHLLRCANVEVVSVPKTEFYYMLECLRSAKIALRDVLNDMEKK